MVADADSTRVARLEEENARLADEVLQLRRNLTAAGVTAAQQALNAVSTGRRHDAEMSRTSARADSADARSATLTAESSQLLSDLGFVTGILESSNDCIKVLDLDGKLEFMSSGGQRVMEVEDTSRIYGCPWPDFWPGSGAEEARNAVEAAKAGRAAYFEGHAPTAKGNARYWEVSVSPIHDADRKVTKLLSISRDISARKTVELERETVANELHHRLSNTLAVVQAIASQSIRGAKSLDDAGREIISRVGALARAHTLLAGANAVSAGIGEVIAGAIQPYDRTPSRFDVAGPELRVSARAALAFVLAINELCTNATKYGALSAEGGNVEIKWWADGETFRLNWKERGGPPVAAPSRRGFGSRLIDLNIKNQLGGTATTEFESDGLRCAFEAPLDQVTG